MALIGAQPNIQPNLAPAGQTLQDWVAQNPMPVVKKPGINWLGVFADALSGAVGQPRLYTEGLMQLRQQDAAENVFQAHHAQEFGDEQALRTQNFNDQLQLLRYKQAHPDDQLTQYLDAAGITDPAERQKYYRARADAMTAPPVQGVQTTNADGSTGITFVQRPTFQAVSSPPSAAVAYLKAHPDQAPAFDQKYGPGTSRLYLGGPTPPASGGFPR